MSVSRILVKLLGNLGRKVTGKPPFVPKPMIPSYKISSPYPIKSKGTPGVNMADLGKTHPEWAGKIPEWSPQTAKYRYLKKFDPRLDSPSGFLQPISRKTIGNQPGPLVREIQNRYSAPGIGRKLALMESRLNPGVGQKIKRMMDLAGHRLPNPRKTQMMEGLMAGRGNPGIAQGLGKMKGRAYSSLNQPGSVVAGTKRSFTNLLRTDKEFEKFVVETVGAQNVAKVMKSPQMRKKLLRDYQRGI